VDDVASDGQASGMNRATSAPKWSVVVPLYNKEAYVEATLRSVLDQAGDDLEIVVVDDGSQDQGPVRVAAIGDARVRLVRQDNGGVSAARNCGIRASRGEWVVFLDADDLLHPQAFRVYEDILRRFPRSAIVAGGYIRVPNGALSTFKPPPRNEGAEYRLITDLPTEILTSGMVFYTSSIAISRRMLEQLEVWFPIGELVGEDLDLWLRVAERADIAYSSDFVAIYRVDLCSSLSSLRIFDRLFPYLERLEDRALRREMPARLIGPSLRLVADARISMARELIRRERRWGVPSLLFSAWRRMGNVRWWFTWVAFVCPPALRWRER
jgi:glycosyltransferase involved in cell wall biosynthesis